MSRLLATFRLRAAIVKLGHENRSLLLASLLVSSHHLPLTSLILDDYFASGFIDLFDANSTITSLAGIGKLDTACLMFDKMPQRDIVTWNSLLAGFIRNMRHQEAVRLFHQMMNMGIHPDKFTFASALTAISQIGSIDLASWVHGLIIEKKIELNFILISALVDMLSKCGDVHSAMEVFDSVERGNVCVWNAMINGLAIHGNAGEAISVFSRMEDEMVPPDFMTFLALLKACSHCGLVEQGRLYFDLMITRYSVMPQVLHYGIMVDLLARAGNLEDAWNLIQTMPMNPDTVIWRALLSGCKTHRNSELAQLAIDRISCLESGDYALLSNIHCFQKNWRSASKVWEAMRKNRVAKTRGISWVEVGGTVHKFSSGRCCHPEMMSILKVLEGLDRRIRSLGFQSMTEGVLMDVLEEEKEAMLSFHSERMALAYGILHYTPGKEIRIFKNLRTCDDCHAWMKVVSFILRRTIISRDRIRFHKFEDGSCSCNDYW